MRGAESRGRRARQSLARAVLSSGSAVAMLIASQAVAQDEEAEQEPGTDRLVVTGTRIQRSGFTTPTPVTVIDRQSIDDLGLVNAGEILQQLPMNNAEVTATATTSGSLNGYVTDANIGAELANLRGLNLAFGTRTLTLVDGRRFVPSTNGGAVDVGLIPANLILRTETVTGGASAAYGSDAVAGVVNIALDHELTGVRGQIDFGETFRGDGEEKHVGLAGGMELFGGRGHVIGGVEWSEAAGIGACTLTRDYCRPWAIFEEENAAERALTTQYHLVPNAVGTATPTGSVIQLVFGGNYTAPSATTQPALQTYENMPAAFRNKQFNDAGTGFVDWRTGGFIDDSARLMAGGEGVPVDDGVFMRVPVERESAYGRFSFDLTNDIAAFVEASYGNRYAENSQATLANSWIGAVNGLLIKEDNAFLPTSVSSLMLADNANGLQPTDITGLYINKPISSFPREFQPSSSADNTTTRFVAGLDGAFGDGWLGERSWRWDAYYTYGLNEQAQRLTNLPRQTVTAAAGAGPTAQAAPVNGLDPNGIQFGITGGAYANGSYPPVLNDPEGIYGVANWSLAVDAVRDPSDGQIKCRINVPSLRTASQNATLANPQAIAAGIPELVAGCKPLNVLGNGVGQGQTEADWRAALDWALGTQVEDYEYEQQVFGANAQGELIDLWSGPLAIAGGFELRDETGSTDHTAPVEYWRPDYGAQFAGSQRIIEGYAETDFSLLRDVPFAQDLAINAAVRRTKAEVTDETPFSNTEGQSREFEFTTWKVTGVWEINDRLRFRATQSKDIRAPSFRELFFPGRPTPNFTIGITNPWITADPETLPSSQWVADPNGADLPRNGGGNPELSPETADTTTVGVVIQPGGFAEGLRLSVDAYRIELADGIANVYSNGIISSCYFLKDPFACARVIPEDPSQNPLTDVVTDFDQIVTGSNNTSNFRVQGVDFEVAYAFELAQLVDGWSGDVSLRALTTYMDELIVEGDNRGTLFGVQQLLTFSGSNYAGQVGSGGVDDIASFSESPEWQGTVTGSYSNGPLRTTLQARWVGEAKLYNDLIGVDDPGFAIGAVNTINAPNEVGSYINWTLSGSYNFGLASDGGRDIELFGVINNLFDRAPEIAPPLTSGVQNSGGGSTITNPTFYDSLGRRYRVGVRFRF